MKLFFFDLETTGTNPGKHGIHQISGQIVIVTDPQTIRRRSLKDNGSFGSWDVDTLANQWDNEKAHFDDRGLRGVWSREDQAAEEAAEEEQPTNLDATNVTEKSFVAKLTFDTDGILQQFIAKYRQQLIDEFGCTVNISGGAI